MKALLSFLISAGIVTCTFINLREHSLPWLPKIVNKCFNSPIDTTGQFRVHYTGSSTTLDRYICTYINLYQQPLHDILGVPILRLLMLAFGTAYTVMALEGSRRGFKKNSLLTVFPLFGLLSNIFGAFTIFSLVFLPLSLYYRNKVKDDAKAWQITLPEAYGTLVGVGLGYAVPSAILTIPYLVKENSPLEQDLLSLWLVLPIFIVPFISFGKGLFRWFGSPLDKISNAELRERMYVAEGKDAVERSYLFLASLNMFCYFGSIWFVAQKGIRLWDSILLLLNAPDQLPANLTFTDLGQLLSTRIVLVSYLALGAGFILWAFFHGGIVAGLVVALLSPIVGPGAAFAFFTYNREGVIQDISDRDAQTRITEKKN